MPSLDRSSFSPFVAGEFAPPDNGEPVVASWGEEPLPFCRDATEEEIERAFEAAATAESRLAATTRGERSDLLRALLVEVERREDDLAKTITAEVGKPISLSRLEVARAKSTIRLGAAEAMTFAGEVVPVDGDPSSAGALAFSGRFPVGTILALTPFNFPLNLLCHKLVPAVAAGCPVIAKPTPRAPRTALLLAEAARAAGWPEGIFSVLPVPNNVVDRLVADRRARMVSFTGSAEIGWRLRASAPRKPFLLELGGNAGVLVDEGADLARAAVSSAGGALAFAGQVCISVQRIYAVREIFEPFVEKLVAAFRSVPAEADPWNPAVRCGPMIDEAAARRIESWIADAERAGARALVRGERNGTFHAPTLLTGVPRSEKVACEEAFGPVAVVEPVADFDEGLARIDDSRYGLQAGVFTPRLDRAKRAFERLRVGAVIVGDTPTFRFDGMPYGGVKDSGLGREGIRWAMREMTEERLLVLR